ncbi:MAG: hypothetical protein KGL18_08455 [Burkholderiales bacterium]|nr:hypothetical protein [Burkholderiales bacterium]MDE1928896.1 hypothetical protein [Burkholderiales bacterium]MDE2502990.1 hypothetical protein [Burkholderiales bacterium]
MTMKLNWIAAACVLFAGAAAQAGEHAPALIVTASNAATNQLLVYDTAGHLLDTIPTQGQGGVGGNAGGIAYAQGRLAVVNHGSSNVTVFDRSEGANRFQIEHVIPTQGQPVSVAFGAGHLYVLTGTQVESHAIDGGEVRTTADGSTPLLHADGSAAQVGVIRGQLIVTEKSNAIESVALDGRGAVAGPATSVAAIPANVNVPLGLATRGDEAYVTIAHANETSLVRGDTVLTTTGSGTQNAPCWLALDGPFLYSANSPSMSVSRYAVYGRQIVQDAAVAASFNGKPTDLSYRAGLLAAIDSNGTASHVSVFGVDEDGNLTLKATATVNLPSINGVAVVTGERD